MSTSDRTNMQTSINFSAIVVPQQAKYLHIGSFDFQNLKLPKYAHKAYMHHSHTEIGQSARKRFYFLL